jgi:hypothetical protein
MLKFAHLCATHQYYFKHIKWEIFYKNQKKMNL